MEKDPDDKESIAQYQPVLKHCPKPCDGKSLCIRTCNCGRGEVAEYDGLDERCTEMTEGVREMLKEQWSKDSTDMSNGKDYISLLEIYCSYISFLIGTVSESTSILYLQYLSVVWD